MLPDFSNYYKAIIIEWALEWGKSSKNKRWVNLETGLSKVSLSHMIWNPPHYRNLGKDTHYITHHTLKIWDQIHYLNKWEYNSPLIYIKDNPFFPPGTGLIGGNWIFEKGAQVRDIISRSKLKTFQELNALREILSVNGWRYNQLKHFIGSLPGPLREEADYRGLEKLVCREELKRTVSEVYKILMSRGGQEPPTFIRKWEDDLGTHCDREMEKCILGQRMGRQ